MFLRCLRFILVILDLMVLFTSWTAWPTSANGSDSSSMVQEPLGMNILVESAVCCYLLCLCFVLLMQVLRATQEMIYKDERIALLIETMKQYWQLDKSILIHVPSTAKFYFL